MGIHRDRRFALALGLLALLLINGVGQCQTAEGESSPVTLKTLRSTLNSGQSTGDEAFSLTSPATDSILSGRPSPFYDGDEPGVAPREAHAQRIPSRAVETPATSRRPPETSEILSELETVRRDKTPLPAADFPDATDPNPSAGGRSGFGSSVAWALGILAAGWLARQFLKSGGPLSMGAPSAIELLSRQSIGPQQQLALVRLGRRILLVGTTPTGMSTLATVDDPEEVHAIVCELRASTSQVGPTLLDLFRSRRSEPTRDSATASVSLSTSRRTASSERLAANREVADV